MRQIPIVILSLFICSCEDEPVSHAVIVTDRSGSIAASVTATCDTLAALTQKSIDAYGRDGRSTLTIVTTGDRLSHNQPHLLIPTAPIPFSALAIEGRERIEHERARLVSNVKRRCASELTPSSTSPILLAVEIGLQQLRAQGCASNGHCGLFIQSDLQETADSALSAALQTTGTHLSASARSSLPTLDCKGIDVFICGYAQGADGGIKMASSSALRHKQQVWTSALAQPASLTFSPFCPVSTESAGDSISPSEKEVAHAP